MFSTSSQVQQFSKLRQDAENQLQRSTKTINPPKSMAETIQLLHELQVYQLELELQNQELQESRAQLEVALAHYSDLYDFAITGYFTFDCNGTIIQTNIKGASFLQLEKAKVIGKFFVSFIAKEEIIIFNNFLKNIFKTQQKQSCILTLSQNGVSAMIIQIEAEICSNGHECRAIVQDITERVQKEKLSRLHQLELVKMTRLNSMGALASAIAHEINQPFAIIANYVNGCIRRLESNNYKLSEILDIMRLTSKQVELAGEIIHHMKSLVRQDETFYKQCSINEIAESAAAQIKEEIHYDFSIPIELKFSNYLPSVKVDPIQIELVILNLLRNSLEAIYRAKIIKPKLTLCTELQNNMIIVSIIDNGLPYSLEEELHLFEPSFTTKKNGMGIGLSISRTIVEAHGGHISSYKLPVTGVCFQFSLPTTQLEVDLNET